MKKTLQKEPIKYQESLFPSLQEAKDFIKEALKQEGGAICPCCEKPAREYKRKITKGLIESLGRLHRFTLEEKKPYHYHDFTPNHHGGDFAKLARIGLLKPAENDDDAKKASGFWSITEEGTQFCLNKIKIPDTLVFYNNQLVRTEGEMRLFSEFWPEFDYSKLLDSYPQLPSGKY